jgi:hypothetical protein
MANGSGLYRRPVGVAPETEHARLTVVCDDGSVWAWDHSRKCWQETAPIPGSHRQAQEEAPR